MDLAAQIQNFKPSKEKHINSNEAYATKDELAWLNRIMSDGNIRNQIIPLHRKINALQGYLVSRRTDWAGIDKNACMAHAAMLLVSANAMMGA